MSKYNIFFTLEGAGGRIDAPNTSNPVEADNWEEVLVQLGKQMEGFGGNLFRVIAVKVQIHE